MDKNSELGVIFLNGGLINLDSADSKELEKYINEAKKLKQNTKMKLDMIAKEIKNS